MRDQRGSLDERALSVLSVFHFVTDLAFAQPHFKLEKTVTAVHSGESEDSKGASQPVTRKSNLKIMKAEVMMKVRNRGAQFSALFFGTLLVSLGLVPSYGFSQAAFFQGKTITVIQGRDPGGTGDLRVKALFPFLQKYIPGNPTIVSEYMPGGGSRKAANHVYRTARPDGLTIGNFSSAVVSLAVLGESGVLYDIDKFFYLGSPYSTYHAVFITRKQLGLNSIEKLQAASWTKNRGPVGRVLYLQ